MRAPRDFESFPINVSGYRFLGDGQIPGTGDSEVDERQLPSSKGLLVLHTGPAATVRTRSATWHAFLFSVSEKEQRDSERQGHTPSSPLGRTDGTNRVTPLGRRVLFVMPTNGNKK